MIKFKLLVIVLFLSTGVQCLTGSFSVFLTPTDTTTSANTTYLLEIYLSSVSGGLIPANSYFTIVFPNDYTLAGLLGITGAMADGSSTTIQLSSSARTLRLDNAFPAASNDDFGLEYNIIGVINPNRAVTTQSFTVTLFSNTNVALFVDTSQSISVTPGVLTCTMVPDMTQV
jgi:hypothetical protein